MKGKLQKYLFQSLHQIDDGIYEVSIYHGELTQECVTEQIVKIKKCFPELHIGFYDILMDRIKECKFSDQRLIDAVNNVIDNCKYPCPTIANFITFDMKIKLHTYESMCKLAIDYGKSVWDRYKKTKIENVVYWQERKEI